MTTEKQKFDDEIFLERKKPTTRQEFIEKATEAYDLEVAAMDTHTVLADDAYEAGLTCEEFAEILIEVGYTRGEAKRRAKQLCAESLAYPSHIFASSPRAEKSAD